MTVQHQGNEPAISTFNQLRNKLHEFWIKYLILPMNVKHVHGKRFLSYAKDELIVVSLAKNAEVYISSFIDHYIQLGVKHIFILDNGSTDNTVSITSKYPQVSVYQCSLSFREYNLLMRQFLLRRFGRKNRWLLCVDIDELFDYPCSDRINLGAFLRYLSTRKYTTIVAYMLDMFSEQPISHLDTESDNLKQAYPYFDISTISKFDYHEWYPYHGHSNRFIRKEKLQNVLSNPEIKHYSGGIRSKIFDLPNIYLIKHPLIFKDGKAELVHQHFVNYAHVADVSGVLYHYKLSAGFQDRIQDAIKNKQYWNDSLEYTKYHRVIEKIPDICFKTNSAEKFDSVNNLVHVNFLHITKEYIDWCEQHSATGY